MAGACFQGGFVTVTMTVRTKVTNRIVVSPNTSSVQRLGFHNCHVYYSKLSSKELERSECTGLLYNCILIIAAF